MQGCTLLACAVWCGLLSCLGARNILVDLTGAGCDQIDGYYLKSPDDVLVLSAMPNRDSMATRSFCDVKVRADQGRRIFYLIDIIKFQECGIEIYMHDDLASDANPLRIIRCSDNNKVPISGTSRFNEMRLRIRKTTTESRMFEFRMNMKNDLGPPFEYMKEEGEYAGEQIEPGVIAGIAIAGAILVIALILLAIYLCIRARQVNMKDTNASSTRGESSVYTSGNSQVLFTSGEPRYPRGRYGSMEDIRSSTTSQEKANGAYANPAYTAEPGEKRSERQASVGRTRGKAGFANEAFDSEDAGRGRGDLSWEERETSEMRNNRQSRRDEFDTGSRKQLKSALKKPTEVEMNKVNTQPINGILKTRSHSPNRSQTSSAESSFDPTAMIHGYSHAGKEHPNVHHKPVIERRRSRSGTRSHRSGSSRGGSKDRRSESADRKKAKEGGRMYADVFIDDNRRRRSGRRSRSEGSRSRRSDRTSDSLDSGSSTTSYSRKVSMNPGGKRVHIKGEETDI